MSIASEITRITGEVGDQSTLITQIETALAGKGGRLPVIQELNVTANGTYNVPSGIDGYDPVNVTVPVAKNIQYNASVSKTTNKTSYTDTGVSIVVNKSGNYKCSWMHYAYASGGTNYLTRLYINGSAAGSTHASPAYNGSSGWVATEANISLTEGQTISVYARTRSGMSYWTVSGLLIIEEL